MPNSKAHDFEEKTLTSDVVFQGKVATVRVDTAQHPGGKVVNREVVQHPGGVVVCPILDDGRIVFVEQWRYPLQRMLLELPAGKLDWPNGVPEDPALAIRRELWEETGYEAAHWEELTYIYTAPGFCDEKLWLYKATGLKLSERPAQPDEDELINLVLLTPEQAWAKVRSREIVDAKTVALLGLALSL